MDFELFLLIHFHYYIQGGVEVPHFDILLILISTSDLGLVDIQN
jgi:hypothetical protein